MDFCFMNYVDFVLLIPILYAAYKGFKNGLIIEVFTLLAFVVGIYAGIHFSDGTASWIKSSWDVKSEYLPVIAFTLTFLMVGAMVYFAGKFIEKVVDVTHLTPFNKIAGVIFGLLKMGYILSILIVLIESYDEKGNVIDQSTKDDSMLYEPIKQVSLTTIPRIKESTIFLKNALQEESDSTGIGIDDLIRAKEVADSLGLDENDLKQLVELHEQMENNK